MDNTIRSVSEFLLERLRESAALEVADGDEAETLPDMPVEPIAVNLRPDVRQAVERQLNKSAANRAYSHATGIDLHLWGSG